MARFADACRSSSLTAAKLKFPPFTTGLRSETPLNSAPYVFDMAAFRSTFAGDEHRARIVDACQTALDLLASGGVRWHAVLIGGSFIRTAYRPGDLDGLVIYSIPSDRERDAEQVLRGFAAGTSNLPVDLKLCPADVHPALLVKRVAFFSNLFAYDRRERALIHGTVMLVPDDLAGGRHDGHN